MNEMLNVLFPAMMILGAAGSLVVNIVQRGEWPTSVQWLGAAILYTGLMFRNMG